MGRASFAVQPGRLGLETLPVPQRSWLLLDPWFTPRSSFSSMRKTRAVETSNLHQRCSHRLFTVSRPPFPHTALHTVLAYSLAFSVVGLCLWHEESPVNFLHTCSTEEQRGELKRYLEESPGPKVCSSSSLAPMASLPPCLTPPGVGAVDFTLLTGVSYLCSQDPGVEISAGLKTNQ